MEENEITIWNQFRQGEKEAYAALFKRTSDRLYRYGIKFTNDQELVKDCIQDLFIKLYQNRADLPEKENVMFYLFTVLKNILIDSLRKNKKIVYISPQELSFHTEFILELEDDNEADEETRERFEQVIGLLSGRQKEAIYLRYQLEMSYEEISKLLGINYQSTRNLIHRAIEKIRSEMNLSVFFALLIYCK
jgi:RNA polymerase sigma factor (sigma-70 family)